MKRFALKTPDSHQKKADRYVINYSTLLNSAQYEAVMYELGPVLVIAGAGSGKTRTLVYRVARLIEDGIHPDSILLLTFTRRAAKEMIQRAVDLLDQRCNGIRGGTFHHYCSRLLHRYYNEFGIKEDFSILDASDSADVLQIIRQPFQKKHKDVRFPSKNSLQTIISTSINKQISIYDVLTPNYTQYQHFLNDIEKIHRDYRHYKRENNLFDFDDLLLLILEKLEEDQEFRLKIASQHQHVLIDEYQDTNKLQAKLIALFSSYHNNVMAVGDDAQSIYSFRGANLTNMLSFPNQFEGTKIIKLEQNYRSTQQILNLANTLLKRAVHKFDKYLISNNLDGELPGLVKTRDESEQSMFISQLILNRREQEIPLNDIAVLFRNGRDSFDLEIELKRRNIPYVKYGGQKITEAAHIKDVLAHLRVIQNNQDEIAWNRLLLLIEGIGPKSVSDLLSAFKHSINHKEVFTTLSSTYVSKLTDLISLYERISQIKQTNVGTIVSEIVDYYKPICKKRYDDFDKRIKDLDNFKIISSNYKSIKTLLDELVLEPLDGTAIMTEESLKEESPLILSTIHSAKGLEWHTVFIIQCLDGIIPSGYSVDNQASIDEELRLLYVAVTRAKEQLLITYPLVQESGFGDYFTNPSRFIKDMKTDLLEPWLLDYESNINLIEDNTSNKLINNNLLE